jgi:hypothetical protein
MSTSTSSSSKRRRTEADDISTLLLLAPAIIEALSSLDVSDLDPTIQAAHAMYISASPEAEPNSLVDFWTVARDSTFPFLSDPVYNDLYAGYSIHLAYAFTIAQSANSASLALRAIDLAILRAGVDKWGAVAAPLSRYINASASPLQPVEPNPPPPSVNSSPPLLPPQFLINAPHARPIPRLDARSLTPESFLANCMTSSTPCILTHAIDNWPALSRWVDSDYLKKKAGSRLIPVETYEKGDETQTYLTDSWRQEVMSLGDYIERFFDDGGSSSSSSSGDDEQNGYLAQHQLFDQIPDLKDDIRAPQFIVPTVEDDEAPSDCDKAEADDPIVSAWFGPGGTVSPLHNDPYHNLLCQVVGRKYIRVYETSVTNRLYPRDGPLCNNSLINLDSPDYAKFPLSEGAPFWQCVLEAGEVLYIPRLAWHYVRGLETSFSVSWWWGARMALVKSRGVAGEGGEGVDVYKAMY